ncbi:unnamed protein product [Rotaria sordida]|uniref:Uncharacterized protein n=1 Tax=Rotaria sordida TaxID=392033 RepID=A0A814EKY0_9BILA|nr:unnamed protein product [Rotaria sordida]
MSSLIDILPTVHLSLVNLPSLILPKSDATIDDNETLIDQLSDQYEESRLIYGNVQNGALVVLWYGHKHSSLRTALIECLIPRDITLIFFHTEEQLWYWLNTNSSMRVASLVTEANINIQNIVSRSHPYKNIRSILIRCNMNQLTTLQRFSRSYVKIDGVYNDDIRLLIRLTIDLALLSEEIGDQKREDENNELEVQRHYERALKLCALAKTL